VPPTDAGTTPPAVPSHFGHYRVERPLGAGSFGIVYLCHHDALQKLVAVKVPTPDASGRPRAIDEYLKEARTVAKLKHEHIVPVFDFGRTEDGTCYIVSEYIDGGSLADLMRRRRLSVGESAAIIAPVAEALHHAHQHHVFHRDVKPANILLDRAGKPYLADFGIALRDEDFGKGGRLAGTPLYMSPEQALGESHRVEGRADVYSLGVVLYELLTGTTPFYRKGLSDPCEGVRREALEEMLNDVRSLRLEVRPPRQLADDIPRELERICLKALAKRASDRYPTAHDFADDLRAFLPAQAALPSPAAALPVTVGERPPLTPESRSAFESTEEPAVEEALRRVVPKGLRAFDKGDADFFLALLPGLRDRHGLPDSISFWKTRIETADPEQAFAVGLLHGPSGCGKSSLVRAGLLPRLAAPVAAVYVEATPGDTEAGLLKGIRKHCPDLAPDLGLAEALAALRQGWAGDRKVLLVLDQFEQFLHAHGQKGDTELVRALRQCDGVRVQALVLVRDDFWMAVARFLNELEIKLLQGHNWVVVDLFDPAHARKVLAAFGRAHGRLADDPAQWSRDEEAFLEQAVAGLAREGRVVPVRLALLAEMVKSRPWSPATLKAMGGTEGVGVAFLEESFSSRAANPQHRLHQQAVKGVLRALLPERGTVIRGHMRSREELEQASGYAGRPRDFADLMYILDRELRLVTPTDPEGAAGGDAAGGSGARVGEGRSYQLTHDYLVSAIRDWLTREQRKTRRGRAELRLAERAAAWWPTREDRQLPTWREGITIRLFTRRRDWTVPQKKMMRRAARYHGLQLVVLVLLLGVLAWGVWETVGAQRAADKVRGLEEAEIGKVSTWIKDLHPYRHWANALLRDALARAKADDNRDLQLRASLALLPVDDSQADYLFGRLLDAEPAEVRILVPELKQHSEGRREDLWAVAQGQEKGSESRRLRAACALAAYDPDSPHWDAVGPAVVGQLVAENSVYHALWIDGFHRVKDKLMGPLGKVFRERPEGHVERMVATNILAEYAADRPGHLAELLLDADIKQFPVLYPKFKADDEAALGVLSAEVDKHPQPGWADAEKERLAQRQANAAVVLLRMGRAQAKSVWPRLKHQPDPRLRSYLIHRLAPLGTDPMLIRDQLNVERDVSIRRALLLCLGEFDKEQLPVSECQALVPTLERLYQDDPDPGLHAAAEWLLRQWRHKGQIATFDEDLAPGLVEGGRRWYVNGQGQTMVVIPNAPWGRIQPVGHSFALAAKEVTDEQFCRFFPDHKSNENYTKTSNQPVTGVGWDEAAAYCNMLSKEEGIAPEQWCYKKRVLSGWEPRPGYESLQGYRLPTEKEWEYACRAGTITSRYYGEADELLDRYAKFSRRGQAEHTLSPPGSLRPNDLGLFDMLGNAMEWCQEGTFYYQVGRYDPARKPDPFRVGLMDVPDLLKDVGWDGSSVYRSLDVGATHRVRLSASLRLGFVGFRVARTSP
jgi:serine/threonine protein kinase/formylglycine-generating enzyme required for sulfatase activity